MKTRYRFLYLLLAVSLFLFSSLASYASTDDIGVDVYTINGEETDSDTNNKDLEASKETNDETDQAADAAVENYSDLKTKISTAPTTSPDNENEYVIEITGNIDNFGASLTIPYGAKVIIQSAGGNSYVLTKNTTGRHFTVKGELILKNIVLDGNNANQTVTATTGGVDVSNSKVKAEDNTDVTVGGKLTMKNGAVIRNCYNSSTSAASGGGGVLVSASAGFEMKGGEIRNNKANYGGGISNNSSVTIYSGTISDNVALTNGGGVYGNSNSVITVKDGNISGNQASIGGGICIYPNDSGTTVTIDNGTISNNIATNRGGGIGVTGNTANSMTHNISIVNGSRITGNRAETFGGGIYSYYKGTIEIKNSSINDNTAGTSGGGVYGDAGGRAGGSVTISGSTLSNNTSTKGDGGGLYGSSHAVDVDNSIFRNNTAGNMGGGIHLVSTVGSPGVPDKDTVSGTSILNAARNSSLTIDEGTKIIHNAAANGGGISVVSRIYEGSNCNIASTLTMNGGLIANNSATSGNGGGIYGVSDSRRNNNSLGGSTSKCNIDVKGGTITQNNAQNGGGVYGESIISANGTNESSCNIHIVEQSTITKNMAEENGGGVYSINSGGTYSYRDKSNSGVTVRGSEISGNDAKGNGGGLFIAGSSKDYLNTLTMDRVEINGNSTAGNGGGVYGNTFGNILVNDGNIIDNAASNGDGGGIFTTDASYARLNVNNSTIFNGNKASSLYAPPSNAATAYGNIASASVSISFAGIGIDDHPLNNYDVNYKNGNEYVILTYDANGGTGNIGYQLVEKYKDAILSDGTGFQNGEQSLIGWSKSSDGNMDYALGGVLTNVTDHVTLYAAWKGQSETPTVNKVSDDDKAITGSGTPGAEIEVAFPNGGTTTTIVDDKGNWSVTIPDGIELKAGDIVTVIQKEDGKDPSEAVKATVESGASKEPTKPTKTPDVGDKKDEGKQDPDQPITEPDEDTPDDNAGSLTVDETKGKHDTGGAAKDKSKKTGNINGSHTIINNIKKYYNNIANEKGAAVPVSAINDTTDANDTNDTVADVNAVSGYCGVDEHSKCACNCNGWSSTFMTGNYFNFIIILILLGLLVLIGIALIILIIIGIHSLKKLRKEDTDDQ